MSFGVVRESITSVQPDEADEMVSNKRQKFELHRDVYVTNSGMLFIDSQQPEGILPLDVPAQKNM
jgi:hypothetical protein